MITPPIEKGFLANPLSAQHILERTLEQKYSPLRFQVKKCLEDNRALTCAEIGDVFSGRGQLNLGKPSFGLAHAKFRGSKKWKRN